MKEKKEKIANGSLTERLLLEDKESGVDELPELQYPTLAKESYLVAKQDREATDLEHVVEDVELLHARCPRGLRTDCREEAVVVPDGQDLLKHDGQE